MIHKTQAEVFIETLAELRDTERERREARRRLQCRVHADRFMKVFSADFEPSLRPPLQSTAGARSQRPEY